MSVSETIVREYFELHGFLVHQRRKYVGPSPHEVDDADFYVQHPRPQPASAPRPFVLQSPDLEGLERAIVVVKGWHTETFSPSRLSQNPRLSRLVQPSMVKQAVRFFGGDRNLARILVLPALPQEEETRAQSIALLRERGIDGILLFRTLLNDLIERAETNRNYQRSDLLQIIRILKQYEFFRSPQMELFKPGTRRSP